jgi:hypothetical protein
MCDWKGRGVVDVTHISLVLRSGIFFIPDAPFPPIPDLTKKATKKIPNQIKNLFSFSSHNNQWQ